MGNGNGTFQQAVTYGSGGPSADSVAVADVNGDGKLDVVVVTPCAVSDCNNDGILSVLLGNGDGTFQGPLVYDPSGTDWINDPPDAYDATSVAVADVNENAEARPARGRPMCRREQHLLDWHSRSAARQWRRDFSVGGKLQLGGTLFPASVAVADVNGDGKPDLLVANQCGSSTYMRRRRQR